MEEVQKVWERTHEIINEGVIFIKTARGMSNNLPSKSENPVAHVRPHGRNAADTSLLPDGRTITKQCFWLNDTYIKKQIELHYLNNKKSPLE